MVFRRVGLLAVISGVAGGALLVGACSSFTSTPETVAADAGAPADATSSETESGSSSDSGVPEAGPPPCGGSGTRGCDERYVFITIETVAGDFAEAGSPTKIADAFCTQQAEQQSTHSDLHYRQWTAFLCTSTESAVGRVATVEAKFVTPDLMTVFPSLDALRTLEPTNKIGEGLVWTGCNATDGANDGLADCADWTSMTPTQTGIAGFADSPTSTAWVSRQEQSCATRSPIYCFESTP